MYYNILKSRFLTDAEALKAGLPVSDPVALAKAGIHYITIEKPEYDKATQGLEPDGPPAPTPEDPLRFVQHMRVYDLLERHKARKKEEITGLRWAAETGGVTLPGGIRILTDTADQSRISTAIQGMRDSGITEVDFKAASGWVKLTLEQLVGIAGLIAAHVQACFSAERALHEAVDACQTLEALNALDVRKGWPGSEAAESVEPEGEVAA